MQCVLIKFIFFQIFVANFDAITPFATKFDRMIHARYLRLIPIQWHNRVALRAEVLGCYLPYRKLHVQVLCSRLLGHSFLVLLFIVRKMTGSGSYPYTQDMLNSTNSDPNFMNHNHWCQVLGVQV